MSQLLYYLYYLHLYFNSAIIQFTQLHFKFNVQSYPDKQLNCALTLVYKSAVNYYLILQFSYSLKQISVNIKVIMWCRSLFHIFLHYLFLHDHISLYRSSFSFYYTKHFTCSIVKHHSVVVFTFLFMFNFLSLVSLLNNLISFYVCKLRLVSGLISPCQQSEL